MIQLSLPSRVTPASCAVPQLNVQNSRMVLRSPISRRVGSPAYFLSCGCSPIEQNWKMRLSQPMRVWPAITTCGPIEVPVADLDVLADHRIRSDHDAATEPRARDGRWRSDGSHAEVERIAHIRSASAATLPSTFAVAEYFQMPRLRGFDTDVDDQLVAGPDRLLEARIVDADEVVHRVVVGLDAHGLEGQYRRRLRHRLDDQHARHHRMVRVVPRERRARSC
jgi:hypothetical protein